MVSGFGFRVQRFMVSSSGFRVAEFEIWDSGFGFRVFGSGTCSAQRSKNLARGLSSTAVDCFSGSLLTSRFATWVRTVDFRLEGTGISLNVDHGLVNHFYAAHVIHLYVDHVYAHELPPACMWITGEHAQDPASEAASPGAC